jgi:hypothetical protein
VTGRSRRVVAAVVKGVSDFPMREGRGSHAAGRELGTMLTVRKSYRRVVRDARRRDTAELTRIERALRRNVPSLDNGALTNLLAIRAVLRARGVEPPSFELRRRTG